MEDVTSKFEPRVLAFTCNWCSYAGADLAGTSRFSYPTNVRIIRVMCSGRVDPVFIIKAFETGSDGILVSGCHPGECHYISGNLKAKERIDSTRKLFELLGLEPERLRLEWISAAEGEKFSRVITDFTEVLRKIGPVIPLGTERKTAMNSAQALKTFKETNVQYCLECGKCTSNCPIARVGAGYSPRKTVERFQLGLENKILAGNDLWMCLTCYLCSERCPSDVRYTEFVRTCRNMASNAALEEHCSHGAIPLTVSRIMTNPKIKQKRMNWLPKGAKVSDKGDTLYFVGCLPHFDVIFSDFEPDTTKIAQSMVKVLNKVGIEPVVLSEERCCGHDLLWAGDAENFRKLAELNLSLINETGASRVITTCAECYRTLKKDYAEFFGKPDFEVSHVSEFLSDLIERGKLDFNEKFARKVTYHDPCRLGRHMNVYGPPRKVIASIPRVELVEMERNRKNAACCGVSSWLACSRYSRMMETMRLREAKNTGAELLVSACPKCQIHWKCVISESATTNPEGNIIETSDLSVLVAEAMKST